MATQRTSAELLAFFVNNVSGNITPSMVRDLIESCIPSMGGMHFDDPGTTTTITDVDEFVKAENASTIHSAYRFSQPQNNRLQYDGDVACRSAITATLSFTCAANNQVLAFAIAVNGVISDASIIRTKVTTGTDVKAVTITAHPTLEPGDYVEVWVANDTSVANITLEHGHVHAQAFIT